MEKSLETRWLDQDRGQQWCSYVKQIGGHCNIDVSPAMSLDSVTNTVVLEIHHIYKWSVFIHWHQLRTVVKYGKSPWNMNKYYISKQSVKILCFSEMWWVFNALLVKQAPRLSSHPDRPLVVVGHKQAYDSGLGMQAFSTPTSPAGPGQPRQASPSTRGEPGWIN